MRTSLLLAIATMMVMAASAGEASAARKSAPKAAAEPVPAAPDKPIAPPPSPSSAPLWELGVASGQPAQAWRLNTQTGELDVCTVSTGAERIGYVCTRMPDPAQP